ncbi:MAG: tetratricopeptide repeat protein [Bacteroidetes bacterium]|nr:tetratricopeptide repeat protein [Bacteroidota bacterium]
MKKILIPVLNIFLLTLFTPSFSASPLDKGIQLLEKKDFKGAIQFFKAKVKENEDDASANYYLGRSYLMIDDYENAVEYCEKAVDLNPKVADHHFWLGQALGRKIREVNMVRQAFLAPDILEAFEKTVELDPKHLGGLIGLTTFYTQAPSVAGGDLEKAKSFAARVSKIKEKQGRLLFIQIYSKDGKTAKAEEEFKAYDKSFVDSTDGYQFYNTYGYFLLEQKKTAEAVQKFEKQAKLAPKDPNVWDSLGDGLQAAGKPKDALVAFEKALKLKPGFSPSKEKAEALRVQLKGK